jgi:hypothetical protein
MSELGGGVIDLSSPESESDDEPPPQEVNRNNNGRNLSFIREL